MLIPGRRELGHLTYCTNIHPAETWPETLAELKRHLPAIRQEVAPGRPFGVGLRLAATAAAALATEKDAMSDLRSLLAEQDAYVFTINGFPYGDFHRRRVKEQVYAPDWAEPERLLYTNRLADILAELLPPDVDGSVSTVPGTFRAWASDERVSKLVENLVRHAAHLVRLRERTGRIIGLSLEPEPRCLVETTEEAAEFFETKLYGKDAVSLLAELTGLAHGAAADALRRHLGLCYDVCHAAVEFEDAHESVSLLREKGVPVSKLQLSSALRVAHMSEAIADRLRPFDEPIYLHQVVGRNEAGLSRWTDLPDALAELPSALGSEWRIHFHVPVFLSEMEHFSTTQDFLREILGLHRETPISDHLEVETYTWDVLPERYRGVPVGQAIARELKWVLSQLES